MSRLSIAAVFVIDMICNPLRTKLLPVAAAAGCAFRSGVGMLARQGAKQISFYTGIELPRSAMSRIIMERLEKNVAD